ncbi:MAG: GNAT family N-acetyltransferase [Myxococcota bacterium]
MELLSLDALTSAPEPFDAAVAATSDIDHFCSSSAWIVPAHAAFHAQQRPFVWRSDDGWLALSRGETFGLGRYLAPLEAMWGLACPLVGPDPRRLARGAVDALEACHAEWDALWLGGLVKDGPLFRELAARLTVKLNATLRLGPSTVRWTASLDGGYEGWLGRRSAKFRANARRVVAKARASGLALEWHEAIDVDAAAALYERILAIEARSWKGQEGSGFVGGDMRTFYRLMVPRLAATGRLRALVATLGGEDVAFVFGGVFAGTYRGLQVSFDDRFRALALGNVMQCEMIDRLAAGGVLTYDLGSDMDYKARWAERGLETVTLVAFTR